LLGSTQLVGSGEQFHVIADVDTGSDPNVGTQVDVQVAAQVRARPDREQFPDEARARDAQRTSNRGSVPDTNPCADEQMRSEPIESVLRKP
jgi:hypothetical protein